MYIGILYNTFVCIVSGVTGLAVFAFLRRIRKKEKIDFSQDIDYFLLLLGLLWTLVGIRIFFTGFNLLAPELFLYKWFIGPLTYLHLIPAFYYFGQSFFKNRKMRLLFNTIFTVIPLLAVFFLFKDGFFRPEVTYWGNNIRPNEKSNNIFTFGIFLPATPLIVAEVTKRIKRWREVSGITKRQLLGFAFGFLIYAIAGFFEAVVFTQGPFMLLARSGIMLSPLTFYLSATLSLEE